MRERQAHVTAQIGRLTESLDLIRFKAGVHEDLVDQGSDTARPCDAPSSAADEERTPTPHREAVIE